MSYSNTSSVLEWNNNLAVLIRSDALIKAINDARFNMTIRDSDGKPQATPQDLITHMISLFLEIAVEMRKEPEALEELKTRVFQLRDRILGNPPIDSIETRGYWKSIMKELDDLDLELRMRAKKHGFLAGNKMDVSKAGLRR